MLEGPAADLGSVDFELALAEHFAGGNIAGSRKLAAEPFAQERLHLGRPVGGRIASSDAGDPSGLLRRRAGFEVIAVKLVEAAAAQAELFSGGLGFELAGAETGHHVTDQWSGTAMCPW